MKTYKIHLIRHGITDGNLKGQYIGRTDMLLCDEGIAHLASLSERYEYPKAAAYFTSTLSRCKQTLDILYPNVNAIAIPDLRECNFGAFEEKSAKDLEGDPEFEAWIAEGMSVAAPNGESGAEFVARTCAAFESIVTGMMKTGTESAVIVCHGGSIMSILSQFGLPRVPFHEWIVGNGQGYSIMIHPRLWMADRVFEIYDKIPSIEQADSSLKEDERMSDLAREAAHKAFDTDFE